MHKKGITEEVAKKRSRRTVKHQRGIVGADLAAIAAKRNQTAAQRTQARQAAITKAKSEKKDKEAKKEKTKVRHEAFSFQPERIADRMLTLVILGAAHPGKRTEGFKAADEGRQGRSLIWRFVLPSSIHGRYPCSIALRHHLRKPMQCMRAPPCEQRRLYYQTYRRRMAMYDRMSHV
jgi:hypothetical protein